ncbi:hypothetical protein A4G29_01405 [Mycobacterium kansasii]|nr:hypothetical protein A4G29_01405 [Mycobacterium kansasii]
MPSKYDENTKARAVRLVREHRDDYDSEWAAMKAFAGRLGMNAETLRKWVRQAEIDAGEAPGVSTEESRELRELRKKNRELEQTKSARPQRLSSRGHATRNTADLWVHRGTQGAVRGRTDPRPGYPGRGDRPAHLLGAPLSSAPSKRALWDTTITEILASYYQPDADGKRPPESLYGSLKMWAHLQRQGIPVARRTLERIMRHNDWRGVMRARRPPRTTEPDPAAGRASDLVSRRWRVAAPNLLDVADFT